MRKEYTPEQIKADRRVLELLARSFPNVGAASSEIINLEAILNLPKGTEHFVADIHGESDAFRHILKNASGNIRRKVTEIFGTSLSGEDIRQLCSLIYYPEQKLEYIRAGVGDNTDRLYDFYTITLHRLVKVARSVSSKYTRSKVRKALPPEFAYIIEELLHESSGDDNKQPYYTRIIETIISTDRADAFITAMCNIIQRLSIDRLHILGDVYDRGPGAHEIMDTLIDYEKFDFQWGNHDALWMGAAAGNEACIASVLRISLRYANLATLEDGYGINLLPLATFAMETYGNDDCPGFEPRIEQDPERAEEISEKSRRLIAQMHKAITIIQFKLEGALIDRHPEWKMESRKLLQNINHKDGTVTIDGKVYPMKDMNLPTIDPNNPYALSPEEKELVDKLRHSFLVSDKLARHVECLLSHGSMFGVYNGNLLFHASIPMNADGTFREVDVAGKTVSGKELMHRVEHLIHSAFSSDTPEAEREAARDYFTYLWCGPDSPLFDKSKMATFERQFIADKETHREVEGHYYSLRNDPGVCERIMDEFGAKGQHRHIINGHVPVKVGKGETPIRADGRLMVIDGGFARAYHSTTGTAGYTLVYHSRGFQLVKHEPFTTAQDAIVRGLDIVGTTEVIELSQHRMRVRDTDKGEELQSQIDELKELLYAFRHGYIKEK